MTWRAKQLLRKLYLSTVEEESGDESMLLGTSTGAEDDLAVSQENGIWERRRSAIFKNKRMVKIKDHGEGERQSQVRPLLLRRNLLLLALATGIQLGDVIARLSPEELGLVIGHWPVPPLSRVGFSLLGPHKLRCSVGSVSCRVFLNNFQNHGICHPLRLRFQSDFERQLQSSFSPLRPGQRGERDAAASPSCDPCAVSGESRSLTWISNDAGKEFDPGRSAGSCLFRNGFDDGFFCECFEGDSEHFGFESTGCWWVALGCAGLLLGGLCRRR